MIIQSYPGTGTGDAKELIIIMWPRGESQLIYSTKNLLRRVNAEKAAETMILMGKLFTQTMKTLITMLITPVLRLCFCKSGYLPERIRRIRKAK